MAHNIPSDQHASPAHQTPNLASIKRLEQMYPAAIDFAQRIERIGRTQDVLNKRRSDIASVTTRAFYEEPRDRSIERVQAST